ncbi:hypothetical protein ACLKA7_013266 [Drosophila subpalustris]
MEKLQPGDACEECLNQGINHKLRYFYINLEEQLLKCESRFCLWPHNDEVSSSSDEEGPPASVQETLNVDDDDNFIVQMLQQLAAETEEPATESIFATETCPMTAIAACVVESTTVGDVCPKEDIVNPPRDPVLKPQAREKCISPKSIPFSSLSNNDKLLSAIATTTATYSLPDLLNDSFSISNLPEQTEQSTPIAACSDADIKFSVSVSELNSQNGVPKTKDPPKTYLYRAPKKASTFAIKEQPQKAEPVKPPSPPPSSRCSAILSKLLDGEKRALELRSVRGRHKRKVGGIAAGFAGSRLELRQQLRQSIKAKQTKEVKEATESEREVEEEAKQLQ